MTYNVSIRITGEPQAVEAATAKLRPIFVIERESVNYPLRKNKGRVGQVMRYIDVRVVELPPYPSPFDAVLGGKRP